MTNQQEFDLLYVTSAEIQHYLGVSRTSMAHARRMGKLGDPIILQDGSPVLYKRADVMPIVEDWKLRIEDRRNG